VDWVRTIRHGVKPNGKPLLIMPSDDYDRLTDDDAGAIVAYVLSLPPADGTAAEFRIPLFLRFLYAAGFIKDSAETIDHTLPPQQPIASTDVLALGAYVAETCIGCHNESLSGGPIPGGDPSWPPAANLTPGEGGVLSRYPTADALGCEG
jgi:mono/diheme cytochrome c family protein